MCAHLELDVSLQNCCIHRSLHLFTYASFLDPFYPCAWRGLKLKSNVPTVVFSHPCTVFTSTHTRTEMARRNWTIYQQFSAANARIHFSLCKSVKFSVASWQLLWSASQYALPKCVVVATDPIGGSCGATILSHRNVRCRFCSNTRGTLATTTGATGSNISIAFIFIRGFSRRLCSSFLLFLFLETNLSNQLLDRFSKHIFWNLIPIEN